MSTEGGFGGEDDEDILGGDEEGGGWDVGDEDLELPPDLVNCQLINITIASIIFVSTLNIVTVLEISNKIQVVCVSKAGQPNP